MNTIYYTDSDLLNWGKEYKQNKPRYTSSQFLDIFPEAKDYLNNNKLPRLKKQKAKLTKTIRAELVRNYSIWEEDNFYGWLLREWLSINKGEELEEVSKEIKKIEFALASKSANKNGITNGMIEIAKNYDWNKLIEVGKNGMTLCPFHSDKRPSMYIKNNYAFCFAENKSWDTIAFVMERDGLSFVEAVKILQN